VRIGIDIDNTITDTERTFLEYCHIYDKALRNNGIIHSSEANVQDKFDWTEDEQNKFNSTYIEKIIKNAIIYDDAKKVINSLYNNGHEIYFITARSKKYYTRAQEATYNWLIKNEVKFNSLICEAETKVDECISNNIDVMFDDSYSIYKLLQKENINCVLFKTEFNYHMINAEEDLFVCKWTEFEDYINEISKVNEKAVKMIA
jgi:Uncharacterized conserved protein